MLYRYVILFFEDGEWVPICVFSRLFLWVSRCVPNDEPHRLAAVILRKDNNTLKFSKLYVSKTLLFLQLSDSSVFCDVLENIPDLIVVLP